MDPFKEFTHGGTLNVAEILFNTKFDYMFPLLAANPECTLTPGANTQGALLALGTAMASDDLTLPLDSTIPAVFTYLGQFIDHNITAQTDREIGASRIATPDGNVMDITPLPSTEVVQKLVNGRRPKLDLNQVYGDGPGLGTNPSPTEGDELFDLTTLLFKVVPDPPGFDVPRQDDGTAIIADMRNNENINISQLHCAFLSFHNRIAAGLPAAISKDQRYIRTRQLVRWAYQYIVLNDYLPNVCDPVVVNDIAANGVRYYAPDNDLLFMPLEFSVAAFRFGHSMIRPKYKLNETTELTLAANPGRGRAAHGSSAESRGGRYHRLAQLRGPGRCLWGSANGAQNRSLDLGGAGELTGVSPRFDDPDGRVAATSRTPQSATGLFALHPNRSGHG